MSENRTVLLVDDDVDLTDAMKVAFEGKGFTVFVAHSGEEGLAAAREKKPDAIVLDVMMGEKHGFQVCKELKEDPETSSIGILVFSAMTGKDDAKHHAAIGRDTLADDFLEKPMKPSEVVEQVLNLVGRG